MCIVQRLKGHISSCKVMGNLLKPFFDGLEGYLSPQVKGTLFENLSTVNVQQEVFHGEECWLEKNVLKHLEELLVCTEKSQDTKISGHAQQYKKSSYHGAIFSPSLFSIWDSHMVIGQISRNWYVGEIKQIFTYPFRSPLKVYFIIQKFRELSSQEALRDPYRQFPLVGGCLYHPKLEDEIEVVPSQEIIAHFAHTPYDKQAFGFPCFHALPLDKVTLLSHHILRIPSANCNAVELNWWIFSMLGLVQCTPNALLLPGAPTGNCPISNFWALWVSCSLTTVPILMSHLHCLLASLSLCFLVSVWYITIQLTHARPLLMDMWPLSVRACFPYNSKCNVQALCALPQVLLLIYMSHLLSLSLNRCFTIHLTLQVEHVVTKGVQ